MIIRRLSDCTVCLPTKVADAQNNLEYKFGHGVDIDYAEALKWYQRALDNGCTIADDKIKSLKAKKNKLD